MLHDCLSFKLLRNKATIILRRSCTEADYQLGSFEEISFKGLIVTSFNLMLPAFDNNYKKKNENKKNKKNNHTDSNHHRNNINNNNNNNNNDNNNNKHKVVIRIIINNSKKKKKRDYSCFFVGSIRAGFE
jgi:hypothetical protein